MASDRIKLRYKSVLVNNPSFIEALDKLGDDDSLVIKDRYAIARARKDVIDAFETYEKLRIDLVKKHGKPQGEKGTFAVDPNDKESADAFTKEITDLQDVDFEIFLNHKIKLSDQCKLSGRMMSVLLDIIEMENLPES